MEEAKQEEIQKVKDAWEVIRSTEASIKRAAFREEIKQLRLMHQQLLAVEDSKLVNKDWVAGCIAYSVIETCSVTLGYDIKPMLETTLPYLHKIKVGRPERYSTEEQIANCIFIDSMEELGSSATQAMKLLMRLRGDAAMTEGHLRYLRDTYKDYKSYQKQLEFYKGRLDLLKPIFFLEYKEDDLISHELASKDAAAAFFVLWERVFESAIEDIIAINVNLRGFHASIINKEFSPKELLFKERKKLKALFCGI